MNWNASLVLLSIDIGPVDRSWWPNLNFVLARPVAHASSLAIVNCSFFLLLFIALFSYFFLSNRSINMFLFFIIFLLFLFIKAVVTTNLQLFCCVLTNLIRLSFDHFANSTLYNLWIRLLPYDYDIDITSIIAVITKKVLFVLKSQSSPNYIYYYNIFYHPHTGLPSLG